jgi:purine-binding chemotaxis protein CheW
MEALYLIVTLAGQRVALPAAPVESVVELDGIVPVPRAPGHIAGLAALRSRVLTIVDCVASLELPPTASGGTARAVIVLVEGHHYGLLVDEVRDVVTIVQPPRPANLALGEGWARVVRGIVLHEGEALPLLDPGALIDGPAKMAA